MSSSRASTRQAAAKANEALQQSGRSGAKKVAGEKRKGQKQEPPSKAKKGKKEDEELQKSEQAMAKAPPEEPQSEKPPAEPKTLNGEAKEEEEREEPSTPEKGEEGKAVEPKEEGRKEEPSTKKQPEPEAKEKEAEPKERGEVSGGTAVKESEGREEALPSNILEKGIIYFFFRPKVSVDEPEGVSDVARTFMVLRPLPQGATLTEGPIGDSGNCRLLMLPKKVLPQSSRERFMGFVEKAGATAQTVKESFLGSNEYETKTRGTQHAPAAGPLAEGVYAITSTTRTSHLAYILTIPSELGEVQTDLGLKNQGSFIISAKNPKYPSSARLPKTAEYPQGVLDQFHDLRWVPMQPQFIDYPNAQFLLIGEAQGDLGKGGITEEKDKEAGKAEPSEELETLEHENEVRAYPLRGDDTVFDDLNMSMKDYPKVRTTWE
ncbi:hypothetical protein AJ80_02059 [Polytolypa hystricis UAMH7299]|uniref:BTB domain transcription factor n=1 Tax=Polytolypa hystricis (strain UAMH7299) TaxID=1447883 RepID=A0A2B7YRY1_POLH7|nr:hypothetical protein AJ80_02059 [Polytolypa hystricis UAMH7299]